VIVHPTRTDADVAPIRRNSLIEIQDTGNVSSARARKGCWPRRCGALPPVLKIIYRVLMRYENPPLYVISQ
jgi:hypothetical protein